MKKNTGLKVLTGTVIAVVALIMMNGKHHDREPDVTHHDPNNLNEAIASQFNDNIRDVAARLQETEKKLARLELENKQLKSKNENVQASYDPEVIKEIEQLKSELAHVKTNQESQQNSQSYTVNGESTLVKEQSVKDIDALLMKRENNPNEQAYWENLKKNNRHSLKKLKQQLQTVKIKKYSLLHHSSRLRFRQNYLVISTDW